MSEKRKYKGIIFDLDGTLLDSMGIWEQVDRAFLRENGIEPPSDVSDIVKKMTIQKAADYFKSRFELALTCQEIIDRIEEIAADMYKYNIALKEGVADVLDTLERQGIKMCIATATYRSLAESALTRLGVLEKLDFILTTGDVGAGKDKPEIFFSAAEKMGLTKNDVIVIEDSLHCIETAKKAGFFTVAVYDKVSHGEWDKAKQTADRWILGMDGFMEIWEEING